MALSASASTRTPSVVAVSEWKCPRCGDDTWIEAHAGKRKFVCGKCSSCRACGKGVLTRTITHNVYVRNVLSPKVDVVFDVPRAVFNLGIKPVESGVISRVPYLHGAHDCSACVKCGNRVVRWKAPWTAEVSPGSVFEHGKLYCGDCCTLCDCGKQGCRGPTTHVDCPVCKQRVDNVPDAERKAVIDSANRFVHVHLACAKCLKCNKPVKQCDSLVVTATGKVYHKRCAPCVVCGQRAKGDGARWGVANGDPAKPVYDMRHGMCAESLKRVRKAATASPSTDPPKKKPKKASTADESSSSSDPK